MYRLLASFLLFAASAGFAAAQTDAVIQTSGAMVIIPAFGEVKHPNDEARATLMIEEQDKDKGAAASRVNRKMKQGAEIVKHEDPQAVLKTRGYYTYPIYADEPNLSRHNKPARQIIGWRVGQYLDMTTSNLSALPKTIAAAQRILALNGLYFGLTEATGKKLEEQRIAAAYLNLTERIAAVAKAMGRSASDVVLDTIDFEASGAYAPQQDTYASKAMRTTSAEAAPVDEPSFEPGETTLHMRVVGKLRFK